MPKERIEPAKACYRAHETRDRELIEELIGDDFRFTAYSGASASVSS